MPPYRLGVAWGRTMYRICEELRCTHRPVQLKQLEVLPIIGITSTKNDEPVEANVIAMRIAQAFGGASSQIPCPAFLDDFERNAACRWPQVAEVLRQLRSCDAVITGMGPVGVGADGSGDDIMPSNDAGMSRQLAASAREAGAVGEVCYWLFTREGKRVSGSLNSMGLGLGGLYRIAHKEGRKVILVAGGDRRRFEPLRVLVNGGYANVLVTDTYTARYLLGEIELPR